MSNEITTTKDNPLDPQDEPQVDPAKDGDHVGPGVEGGTERENPDAPDGDLSGDEAAKRDVTVEAEESPRSGEGYHVDPLELDSPGSDKVPEPKDHPQGSAAVDEDPEEGHNHPETAWCVESCPRLSRKRQKS